MLVYTKPIIGTSLLTALASFNIEYSCHTITNIKHGWQLSLQLMTNSVSVVSKLHLSLRDDTMTRNID